MTDMGIFRTTIAIENPSRRGTFRVRSGKMRKDEQRCIGVRNERTHIGNATAKQRLDFGSPAVAQAHPDNVRRRATQEAPLSEVIVLGDDHVPARGGETPDRFVVGAGQAHLTHVCRPGIEVGEAADQARGEILVEEEARRARAAHAAVSPRSRRSRSAAKAKAARISSRSRSGKSVRMSSSLMPPAR